ncbi:MAG TPA: hypothetical protein VND99_03945 [Candidatus Acidoferrales bacterium]|nr:hypothetical protein [Candidatus Acidoferrales bacterium]
MRIPQEASNGGAKGRTQSDRERSLLGRMIGSQFTENGIVRRAQAVLSRRVHIRHRDSLGSGKSSSAIPLVGPKERPDDPLRRTANSVTSISEKSDIASGLPATTTDGRSRDEGAVATEYVQNNKGQETDGVPHSSEELITLPSFMHLEESPVRMEMDQVFERIGKELEAGRYSKANTVADSMGRIDGIEILRRSRDYGGDFIRRCEYFVFGIMNRENWAYSERGLTDFVTGNMQFFLEEEGYQILEEEVPVVGDVVAYHMRDEDWNTSFEHFGILGPNGKVISKFGLGPIVRHPLKLVPSSYGDSVYFFHKSEEGVIPRDAIGFERYLHQALQEQQLQDLRQKRR